MFKVNGVAAMLVLTVATAVTSFATAAAVSGQQIYGCISKTGNLSQVATKAHTCPKGTTALTWNAKGLQGEKGADGAKGDPGRSDVYFGSGWLSLTTEMANVVSLSIPAGNYLAEAYSDFPSDAMPGQAKSGPVCEIYNVTTSSLYQRRETESAASQWIQKPIHVDQTSEIVLRCAIASIGGDHLAAINSTLSFTSVGNIH